MTRRKLRRASRRCCATARRCLLRRRPEPANDFFQRLIILTMAGHSRWAKVKHFKGGIDAKRAQIFAKLGREITVAAKIGGGDPDMNPRVRMVLLRGRA